MNSKNVKLVSVLIGVLLVSMAYSATVVTVDPADRLMNKVLLGEWNTAGNLEGWTGTSVSGLTATGGNLQGTGTAATPTVQRTSISGGPDLDWGYFDYLQIRIRVPSAFTSDVGFSFGTSVTTGFATSREFIIPNASLVKDNALHAYRLDLGLDMFWRNTLTDIQIKPLGSAGNGVTFYIDYIEVGDLPGDTLSVNTDGLNIYSGETLAQCSRIESKHYVLWYSPQSYVEYPSFNPTVMGRRACRMAEESYQVYLKVLNHNEPCTAVDGAPTGRWKTNHVTWYSGFWMGGDSLGFGYVGISGGGLLDEGWGNPTPHEYGHVLEMHQAGNLAGGHWESYANILQNARNMHFSDIPEMGGHPTNMNGNGNVWSNLHQDHGRLIYSDFRVHLGLAYYPGTGNPWDLMAQTWKNGSAGMTIYDKLATLITGGASAVPDTVTSGLRHHPFLDFGADSAKLKIGVWDTADNKARYWYFGGGYLVPCQDKSGWWRVPSGRSPEKYGYVTHLLVPSSTSVTVEVRGMDVLGTTEGWRWSLAEVNSSDTVLAYSNIFAPGTQSWTMSSTTNRLYLIVVATPTDTPLNLDFTDNRIPIDKCAERLHYGYEVRLVNCTPATSGLQLNITESGGHAHSNGGGYVGPNAIVASTAYVGPNARVLGTSDVLNYARIEDYAVVMGNATVQDYAVVSGYAVVSENTIIKENAKVRDRAHLFGGGTVQGNVVLQDFFLAWGSPSISGSVIARGTSLSDGSTWSGTGIAEYDITGYNWSDGTQFCHVPWGGWYDTYYVQTKRKARGLIASYRTEETEGEMWWDEFGTVHGLLRGTPERIEDTSFNSKVMRFDGTTEWAALERGLCDTAAGSISLWVKPDDNTDRPLLFMGSSATKYLKLALNASAYAVFTITDGSTTNTVTSTSTIPTGSWTHLAVTVSGTQLKIYVNGGTPQATTSSTLIPNKVLGSNDYTNADGVYVGRDFAGALYDGDLEDVRIYNVAMTDAEVANEKRRCGDIVCAKYWDASMDFNGTTTTDESGIRDGLTRVFQCDIYPRTSDDVAYYEGIFDSSDELDGNYQGTGIGLDNRRIKVRLENTGFWDTGYDVTLNTWQTIKLKLDGTTATLYVGGIQRAQTNYNATASSVAGKMYRIGYASDTTPTKYYFDGLIRNLTIGERSSSAGDPTSTPTPTITATPTIASSIPQTSQIIFSCITDSLPASGGIASWSTYLPRDLSLTAMGSPTAETLGSYKWEHNVYADGDGFVFGSAYQSSIACNGASVVVAVKPTRSADSGNWRSVVDVFYDRLVIGLNNNDGKICVRRNGSMDFSSGNIPDGQVTVLSIVVQPTGTYQVWANGTLMMDITSTSAMTSLVPGVPGEFGRYINVGRNNPDGWTTTNGNIGDVFLYKVALSTAERTSLEGFIQTRLGAAPVATNTPTNTPTATPTNTQSGNTTTYNFVGVTTATVGYNAYACDVDVFPFAGNTANRNSMVEATDAQYVNISANNTAEWMTVDPGLSDEIFLWVEMKINEPVVDITNINLTFNGNSDTGSSTFTIYVKDKNQVWQNTAAWIQVGTTLVIQPDVDTTMTRSITSNFSTYIDASAILTWGVASSISSEDMRINYLEMVVTH